MIFCVSACFDFFHIWLIAYLPNELGWCLFYISHSESELVGIKFNYSMQIAVKGIEI